MHACAPPTACHAHLPLPALPALPAHLGVAQGPHFWDECPFPATGPCGAGQSGDFAAYVRVFSRAADLIRSRPNAITGEASSNTFTSANGVYLRGAAAHGRETLVVHLLCMHAVCLRQTRQHTQLQKRCCSGQTPMFCCLLCAACAPACAARQGFRGDKPWAAWAGPYGANVSMPSLLREAAPYLRLIVLFRDPVDRYQSAFYYYRFACAAACGVSALQAHARLLPAACMACMCAAARQARAL